MGSACDIHTHQKGRRTGTWPQVTRDLVYKTNRACHLSRATLGYMPTGDTRCVVLYIYTCNANRVPLEQLLLGDQRLGYSIRLVVEQTYHPNGSRTRTSHQ